MENEEFKQGIIALIVGVISIILIIIFISIPIMISEKRNIEKELKMKEIEIYGEYRNQ